MRARRLPGCAASRSPRRAALRFLRLTPEWPRLPPARLAGEPADSAPLSPAPAPRSHPAPRPGHARWSTRASEPGGAVPAGKWGRGREGRPHHGPWTPAWPALLDRVPVSQTRRLRGGEAVRLLRARRTVSDLTQSRPANTLSLFHGEGNWGSEKRSHLSEDTRRLDGYPARRVLRAPAAQKFPASSLAALPAFPPPPAPTLCLTAAHAPASAGTRAMGVCVWEAPSIPPPPATLAS